MKILVAGDWHSELHEQSVYLALQALGHDVMRFSWHEYFTSRINNRRVQRFDALLQKAQNKYLCGPLIWRLNGDLLDVVRRQRPDLAFIYRGTHVWSKTLQAMKHSCPQTVLVGFNNDDPFSPRYPTWYWRHFRSGLKVYDLTLAYRSHNLHEFRQVGARRVELLRSWFMPWRNYPVALSANDLDRYQCDVVFIGHYEDDNRSEFLASVVRQGWRLKLFGPGYEWDSVVSKVSELRVQKPVRLVWGEEYNKALNGAKIALCFLSKLNRDTYTRRCFEIPATRTFLLSEYSDDLANLFREGEEAEFFRTHEEFMSKIQAYLTDEPRRQTVADGGLRRVRQDGHDVVSRMRQVLAWVDEIREQKT